MSRRARALLGLALLLTAVLGAPARSDAASGPSVVSDQPGAAPGTSVLVRVVDWPSGSVVTVVVCGNAGRRGSQDCDLLSGQSVHTRGPSPEYVLLPVALPPAPCPCVVRASDVTSLVVALAPFDVIGAPTAPIVGPESVVAAVPLTVRAEVHQERGSFFNRLRRVLGGPSHRRLVLELHNTSGAPLSGVVVTAALGRHATGGSPLDAPAVADLAPGERRSIELPLDLEAPVHGRYVVSGQAFTGGQAVPFATTVHYVPWALLVMAGLVAVAVVGVVLLAVRHRERARRPSGDESEHSVTGPVTLGEQGLPDPNPDRAAS
jgi:hypothetical protein